MRKPFADGHTDVGRDFFMLIFFECLIPSTICKGIQSSKLIARNDSITVIQAKVFNFETIFYKSTINGVSFGIELNKFRVHQQGPRGDR